MGKTAAIKLAYDIFGFAESIDRHDSVEATMAACVPILSQFGADHFAFCGVLRDHASFPNGLLAWRYPEEMLELYAEGRYGDVDPVLPFLRQHGKPFLWRDVPPVDDETEPQARKLAGLIGDFGLANALFIPMNSAHGFAGNVWFAGENLDVEGPNKQALHFLGIYAFEHIHRLVCPPPTSGPKLTPREKEVMTWTAQGKSAWEIGEILGIAVRTVNEHMLLARQKLGATNRAQAVALAIRDRHIDL